MTQALQTAPLDHYRVKHVVKAEVAKILTLRSTAIMLGLTVVAGLLVTGLVSNSALGHDPGWYLGFDPTQQSLTGMIVAALIGGVFGALLITGEYSSGTIRSTLSAAPRRPTLLAAKIGVTTAAVVVFCEVLSFVSFFLGQAILSGQKTPSASSLIQSGQGPAGPDRQYLFDHLSAHASLGTPGALRAVFFTGLFIALMALMAFGFGLIFRSTAAAIAAFVAVVFVIPLVMRGISQQSVKYLPTNMLINSVMQTVHQPGGDPTVSAGVGLLLMAIYAVVVVAAGCILFNRRDA